MLSDVNSGAWVTLLRLCSHDGTLASITLSADEELPAHQQAIEAQQASLHTSNPLLPQDCGLTGFPSELQPASALRRLRIADMGAALHMAPADLTTLSALHSLTFLGITKAPLCDDQ